MDVPFRRFRFIPALYDGQSNLTEWYFPTRMILDLLLVAPYDFASKYGINMPHKDGAAAVPKIEFVAGDTFFHPPGGSATDDPIIAEGMNHLDPMFAVANAPTMYQNPIIDNLIDFAIANTQP